MGLILDTSILIAYEKGKFELPLFLDGRTSSQAMIAAITASELLHGIERALESKRKALRKEIIESLLQSLLVLPFTLQEAQVHARIWADRKARAIDRRA